MVVAEDTLPLCQALLKQRQRAVVFALGLEQKGNIVERRERVGVVVAENAIALRQALLIQRQRAVVFALGVE